MTFSTITLTRELTVSLAEHRRQLGLSQAKAARLAGVGVRTLQRLEAGPEVLTPTTVRIATAYLGVAALLNGNGKAAA